MLARLYLALGDHGQPGAFDNAWKNVEITLKIDPYYAEAYETKGALYERQGKLEEAAAMYEKAFAVNYNLLGSIQKIEELDRKLGRLDRARQIFDDMYRRFPDNIELFKARERVK